MPRRLIVAGAAALLGLSGCSVGSGAPAAGTQLRVTSDFGARPLIDEDRPKTAGEDTVLRLLQRNARQVETRFGGGFVQSIDGVSGGRRAGAPVDWFFYVNGYIADKGAAQIKVRSGDRVWWDRHAWGVTDRVPAVVGSFPEPFVHGYDGNRHPVRIECAASEQRCEEVQARLTDFGVVAALGAVGRSFTRQTLRILVGTWPDIDGDPFAATIGRGPKASGVFSRFSADGRSLTTLDERGRPVRTLGPGTGLIAATAPPGVEEVQSGTVRKDPIWVVTGTDDAGLQAAIGAFDEGALAGRFAVAVVDGRPVALPEPAR